jgi:prophage tail gpP-like protein
LLKFRIGFNVTIPVHKEVHAQGIDEAMRIAVDSDPTGFTQGEASWLLAQCFMEGEEVGELTKTSAYKIALINSEKLKAGEEVDSPE